MIRGKLRAVASVTLLTPALLLADVEEEQPGDGPTACAECEPAEREQHECWGAETMFKHIVRSDQTSAHKITNVHGGTWYCYGCGEAVQEGLHTITQSSECGGSFAAAEAAILLYAAAPGLEQHMAEAVKKHAQFVTVDAATGTLALIRCNGEVASSHKLSQAQRDAIG